MKNVLVFGAISVLVLVPVSSFAQTITPSPATVYPTGYTPPINNINNGIQGPVGGFGSQCGTTFTAGLSDSNNAAPTTLSDRVEISRTNNIVAQFSVTHYFGNPCLNQKEQVCLNGKSNFILQNPLMPIAEKQANLALFDTFCAVKK
jgi:hypothetical protein